MDPEILDAQGQQTAADDAGNPTPGQETEARQDTEHKVSEGVQRRFDELTARMRENERRAADWESRYHDLVTRTTTQASSPAEPEVELDPEERKRINAVLAPVQRKMDEMARRYEAQIAHLQVQAMASQEDPAVLQRAQALYSGWQRAGLSYGFEDALTFAAGEVARKGGSVKAQARDERGRFNAAGQGISAHGAPVNVRPTNQTEAAVPSDIDSWPEEKQAEFWEKRLGNRAF